MPGVQRLWILGEGVDPFDFDSVVSEDHTSRLEICENPVETGVLMSDHVFMRPRELVIQAVVTNTPLEMRTPDHDKVTELNTDKAWLIPADSTDSETRAQRAFGLLLALQESGNPFNIQTGLKLYEDMLVKELTTTTDANTEGGLVFRATVREVQFTSTETITYPPRADKKTTIDASKKTTSGEKQATPPAPEKRTSVLAQGLRLF